MATTRPASITVFAVLNIFFGAFGILGVLSTFTLLWGSTGGTYNPIAEIIRENAAYALSLKILTPLSLLSSAAMFVAGIGLLRGKEWARKLSIVVAIYLIAAGLFGLVLNAVFVAPKLMETLSKAQGQTASPEAAGAIGGLIGGLVGGVFGLIYPILLWIFMTRRHVVSALAAAPGTPPALPPEIAS